MRPGLRRLLPVLLAAAVLAGGGVVVWRLGRPPAVESDADRLLERGDTYDRLGARRDAERTWRLVLARHPGTPAAAAAAERLRR